MKDKKIELLNNFPPFYLGPANRNHYARTDILHPLRFTGYLISVCKFDEGLTF